MTTIGMGRPVVPGFPVVRSIHSGNTTMSLEPSGV